MARYVVTSQDKLHISFYLNRQLLDPLFLSHLSTSKSKQAKEEFRQADSFQAFNEWVSTYLTAEQQQKVKVAVRQRRKRWKHWGATKSVTLSKRAHAILKHLADRDGVTYSQVIETRLGRVTRSRSR